MSLSTGKTTTVIVVCLFVVVLGGLFYWLSHGECVRVKDATSAWKLQVSRPLGSLFSGLLAVFVQGEINGSADLHTSAGTMHLATGPINKLLLVQEYWTSKCVLDYQPIAVTSGRLTIKVALGCSPSWAEQPLLDVEPVNYTGGWCTWHPGRRQTYSEGFYRDGKKDGAWMYWDESGTVIRTEDWEVGNLLSTGQK